ncbi:MAG: Co2+/Mg2+ efflux protein ApaG [Planctomycetota bacterium]|nr:Co2+/Mg2+ efflux protein ApaG [Planctomycetota bacterium]
MKPEPRGSGSAADASPAGASDRLGSELVTDGIRVSVEPKYLPTFSDPEAGRFVFGYSVRITNESGARVRVTRRYWRIVDADGEEHIVDQPGVVGQTPFIEPGGHFEYSSYCPLPTSWGTMEGHFTVERSGGEPVRARVQRFYLAKSCQ